MSSNIWSSNVESSSKNEELPKHAKPSGLDDPIELGPMKGRKAEDELLKAERLILVSALVEGLILRSPPLFKVLGFWGVDNESVFATLSHPSSSSESNMSIISRGPEDFFALLPLSFDGVLSGGRLVKVEDEDCSFRFFALF
jgi:hypothetical protein